ncbi:carbonic anhydrase [Cadophora sp. MPI-SDFR-AT-0126]|nr:carbonic anhydrase [Leotiomycetes sp. MPI-SDFR-AT-0126]
MADVLIKELLDRNKSSLATYTPPVRIKEIVAHMPPGQGMIFIVSCADARINPNEFLGLKHGEAQVIRNAGGRAMDAFRSLQVMGTIIPISLVVVVHHSDCGGLNTTDDEVRSKLSKRAPTHAHEVQDTVFGTFRDIGLDESIRQDVETIKNWAFLPQEAKVLGYAFDIETGIVREVI